MSIFDNLTTQGIEAPKDSLGGSFSVLESGIYLAKIKAVYVTMSKNNAMAANVVVDINGREYREQLWITNANGENWYKNKQTGHKVFLDGFTQLNDICLCTVGKELRDMETEPRVFNIYNFESKSEVPTEVPTVVELMGKEVLLGIMKETVNKRVKNADGHYVDSAETRDENHINKVFHAEKRLTVNEARAGKSEPEFYTKWLERNEGKTRDRSKAVSKTASAPAAKQPSRSLFN